MLDGDTDAIMHARYIADQVRLGKRTLSAKERSALAMGFDACDRQRAAHARAAMGLRLSPEEREALEFARKVLSSKTKIALYELEARYRSDVDRALSTLSKLLAADHAIAAHDQTHGGE